jgi:HEAT repeat protein
MGMLRNLFGGSGGPSERQIRRALKQAIQIHGDPNTRVGAMERLAAWRTPEAVTALLRRFTVQVPQATMDQDEKQYTVRLLVQAGRIAVDPILNYVKTEPEVTWPVRALREILPAEEFTALLKQVLEEMAGTYTRWPEAKAVVIEHVPEDAFPLLRETVLHFLEDEDDDVCIAAVDYLARHGDEEVRERLLQTFLAAEARPRLRGRILDQFCEHDWQVKGYRKKMEEAIADPFYITSKGTVRRRAQ